MSVIRGKRGQSHVTHPSALRKPAEVRLGEAGVRQNSSEGIKVQAAQRPFLQKGTKETKIRPDEASWMGTMSSRLLLIRVYNWDQDAFIRQAFGLRFTPTTRFPGRCPGLI
jgi:hypothetical protein